MTVSSAEQYLIELINRDRLDPAAAAAEQRIALNQGITSAMGGPLQTTPMQVLAPQAQLEASAADHNDWQLRQGTINHTGQGGSSVVSRVQDTGYKINIIRENLSVTQVAGRGETAIMQVHIDNLYASPSHRAATFDARVAEIGIAVADGGFRGAPGSYLTELFGRRSGVDPQITGVAYSDSNRNDFYSIGEGMAGVSIAVGGASASTAAAGGYALSVAAGTAAVTVSMAGRALGSLSLDVMDGNAKLDLVQSRGGDYTLALSASAVLGNGIDDARLLGAGNLDLAGNAADNTLTGNAGANAMQGGAGRDRISGEHGNDRIDGGSGGDRLLGGKGRDVLTGGDQRDIVKGNGGADRLYGDAGGDRVIGGGGRDRLDGGAGNDVLKGGKGADTFVFNDGADRIIDFRDNDDTLAISAQVAGGQSVQQIINSAEVVAGNLVIDFGNGDVLTLNRVTNADILANDLVII